MAAVPSRERAEAEALAGLYDRHARRIFGFCLQQLRRRDEAEDAVQMTFMYALGALHRGVEPVAESAWLLKIAHNVCLNRFDAARRRGNVELLRDPVVLAETAPASEDPDSPHLYDALAHLPERQQRAIVMREWQGLTYAEIAAELELSPSAVETLIFRARRSLAKELRDERRRALDLGSLLGAGKSLLAGGATKVGLGAVAVATVGAAASVPLAHDHAQARTAVVVQRPAVVQPAATKPKPAAPVRARHVVRRTQRAPVHVVAPVPVMHVAPDVPEAPAAPSPTPAPREETPTVQVQVPAPPVETTPAPPPAEVDVPPVPPVQVEAELPQLPALPPVEVDVNVQLPPLPKLLP